MGGVIFSQVKGLVGRTFILAGLAPSALLIIGVYIYLYGIQGVSVLVGMFTNEETANSVDANILVLSWLFFGVLFVVFKLAVMHFIVELPGLLLGPLRYYLESRMLIKRERLFRKKERLLYASTAIVWYTNNFSPATFVPPFIKVHEAKTVIFDSGRARRIIEYLIDSRYSEFHVPTHSQMKSIIKGLFNLYAYGAGQQNDLSYYEEIAAWKKLAADQNVIEILNKVSDSLRRRHAYVHKQYNAYPEDLWIKPTVLGNLVSALDDYSEKHYGIDTATVWPRLWNVINENEKKEVIQSKFQVELLINHMLGFLIVFILTIINSLLSILDICLFETNLSWWGIVLFSGLMLIFAGATYRGAVFAFYSFKEKTTSLIDLNRHVLLKKLGFTPLTVGEEIELFKELHGFFVQATPRDVNRKIIIE